jgi:hypothetical protein
MQRTQYRCIVIIALILIIPVCLFLVVIASFSPPPDLLGWFYWILATVSGWVVFLAAGFQLLGYDLRTICSTIGDKLQMNKSYLNDSASEQEIHAFLNKRLNYEELKTFCFIDLSIDFDDLSGEGKSGKIRELISYCKRQALLTKLITAANQIVKTNE